MSTIEFEEGKDTERERKGTTIRLTIQILSPATPRAQWAPRQPQKRESPVTNQLMAMLSRHSADTIRRPSTREEIIEDDDAWLESVLRCCLGVESRGGVESDGVGVVAVLRYRDGGLRSIEVDMLCLLDCVRLNREGIELGELVEREWTVFTGERQRRQWSQIEAQVEMR